MFTPLERFLSSQCEREINKDGLVIMYEVSPPLLPNIGANNCVFPPPSFEQECGIYDDGLVVNGEASYCSFNYDRDFGGIKSRSNVELVLNANKRMKGGACSSSTSATTNLVKGQWTEEEDRLLVKLVKQHGVRKWSQIAKKLVGRIGKQCRERWRNHLRPDIKQDTWSEEEEKLLIEVHEKVGNRWAEIAKQIPGRSENSIKNHWNATKRRQNSKRKSKRKSTDGSNSSQPSILQEYIRRKTVEEKALTSPALTSLELINMDDDCMQAMQNFYVDFSQNPEGEFVGFQEGDIQHPYMADDPLDFLLMDSFEENHNSEMFYGESLDQEIDGNTDHGHIYSDNYLSYLFDGGPSSSLHVFENDSSMVMGDIPDASICKKDMDLLEMLSSSSSRSSCTQGSNSSRGFT